MKITAAISTSTCVIGTLWLIWWYLATPLKERHNPSQGFLVHRENVHSTPFFWIKQSAFTRVPKKHLTPVRNGSWSFWLSLPTPSTLSGQAAQGALERSIPPHVQSVTVLDNCSRDTKSGEWLIGSPLPPVCTH